MKHLFPHIILCLFIIFLITGCREPSSGRLVVRKSTLPDSRTTQEWICIADSFRNIEQKDSALFYLKKAEQSLSEDVSVYQYYHIYRSLGELNQETFNPSSAKDFYHQALNLPLLTKNDSIPILYNLLGIYYYFLQEDSMTWCYRMSRDYYADLDSTNKITSWNIMFLYGNELWGDNSEATEEHAIRAMKCASWRTTTDDASLINSLKDQHGNLRITDSICQMVNEIQHLPRRANLNYLLYREAIRYKQYPLATKLSRRYIADVDSFITLYTGSKVKNWEEKFQLAELRRLHAETRSQWYGTILISILGILVFGTLAYLYIRWLKARRASEVIKLQLEKKELEEKKHQSEIRTRQLETIYRAKRISLSPQDAEAFQLFRKIVTEYHYEPTSERKILQHWMNVAFHDFSDRLENRCKDLSEREKDICYLSALGLDCENIAEILEVQPRSIERYISNICKKLGFEKGTKKLFVDFISRWK